MRALIFSLFISLNLFSQTQKEVNEFHDSFMTPYNDLAIKISNYSAAVLKHSPNSVLIANRDQVVAAMKVLKTALRKVKPIQKDFTLLVEVKKCATAYERYIKENMMSNQLSAVPSDARANIKLIRKYQKINKSFEVMGERIQIRQKKLFAYYKFKMSENAANEKIKVHRSALKYYYNISVDQFKVQAQLDDFIDAYNVGDPVKMKVAKTKGGQQVIKALSSLSKEKAFQGDNSIIEDSKRILKFYQTFFKEKTKPMIKVHSFPEELADHQIDAYNKSIDNSNASLDYYNTLQPILDKSNVLSGAFFKRHIK